MHRFISRVAKTLDVQHSCFGDAVVDRVADALQNRSAPMCQIGVSTRSQTFTATMVRRYGTYAGLKLLSTDEVAIDGSKFKAVNSRRTGISRRATSTSAIGRLRTLASKSNAAHWFRLAISSTKSAHSINKQWSPGTSPLGAAGASSSDILIDIDYHKAAIGHRNKCAFDPMLTRANRPECGRRGTHRPIHPDRGWM